MFVNFWTVYKISGISGQCSGLNMCITEKRLKYCCGHTLLNANH